jgi:hypothetical protein
VNFLASLKQKAATPTFGLAVVAMLSAGCRREGIQVYRIAKETPATASSSVAAPAPAPAGWEPGPAGQMRFASFHVKGKDGKEASIAVVPLPGMAGSDLANVNRWRDQVGLGPVGEGDLAQLQQPVEIAGLKGQLYDFTGENAGSGEKTRMLAAAVRRNDTAWFFKMTGDESVVAEQKPAFLSYIKTFQFPSDSGGQSARALSDSQTELPPNHPAIGGSAAAPMPIPAAQAVPVSPTGSDSGKPAWKVPPNWHETERGQFLVAKFLIPGPNNTQAAVNVSSSGGSGGGLLMNVNRWRQQQLGLPAVDEAGANELAKPLDAGGTKAMLVDMAGQDARTGEKARIIAAIVPQTSQTWFYKLMGPPSLVEREKDNFIKFVQTARYTP